MTDSIQPYTAVVVGTGFASTFFLHGLLRKLPSGARVLVLERGPRRTFAERMEQGKIVDPGFEQAVRNFHRQKQWYVNLAFGGGSNCWAACTPRLLPADFEMQTRYGVGRDWPLTYADLEPYYCEAEGLMKVSGPSEHTPFPRSRPYPLPPHRLTEPDLILQRARPDAFFVQPCARPSVARPDLRRCCATGNCPLCPIDSKFTVLNGLMAPYEDERVELRLGVTAEALDFEGGRVSGVSYVDGKDRRRVRAELVALGCSAVFNPFLLLRSGLDHPQLGRGLHEQMGTKVQVLLDGVDNFQGSTMITGHGYMLYDGEHRRERGACLIETFNIPKLRPEAGRWRQLLELKLIVEDLPRHENAVELDPDDPSRPVLRHERRSEYATKGLEAAVSELSSVLRPLPVEDVRVGRPYATEYHVLGTTVMGRDPATSVIDAQLRHHRHPNLLALGGGAFPTSSPANPTLTICALSLRAAARL